MRYKGTVKTWKDDKGFGFVTPAEGGSDIFLHISAFSRRHRRPKPGERITYELDLAEPRRPKAKDAAFTDEVRVSLQKESTPIFPILAAIAVLGFIGYVSYVYFTHPNSSIPASAYKILLERPALHNENDFQCQPVKNFCSQMTSCSEAFFHQERCGASEMDGDHDGIPCEQQWCK
ncbi:MAG: cold shock domain-containing protein [Steroidobacteraceae bacterium]